MCVCVLLHRVWIRLQRSWCKRAVKPNSNALIPFIFETRFFTRIVKSRFVLLMRFFLIQTTSCWSTKRGGTGPLLLPTYGNHLPDPSLELLSGIELFQTGFHHSGTDSVLMVLAVSVGRTFNGVKRSVYGSRRVAVDCEWGVVIAWCGAVPGTRFWPQYSHAACFSFQAYLLKSQQVQVTARWHKIFRLAARHPWCCFIFWYENLVLPGTQPRSIPFW